MFHFGAGMCTVNRPLLLANPTPAKTWHEAGEIGEKQRKTAKTNAITTAILLLAWNAASSRSDSVA